MKKYFFIALAMVAAITVSCKNNKAAENSEEEIVETAKEALADEVLASLDGLAQGYYEETALIDVTEVIAKGLNDEEKLVKPDYLLEANQTKDLLTKTQKTNALAFLIAERPIREAYGMPTDEIAAEISHLAADINFPLGEYGNETSLSDRIKNFYQQCTDNDDVVFFWQFVFAMHTEFRYLISYNADAFFRNITEEQNAAFNSRAKACLEAMYTLAAYDEEMATISTIFANSEGLNAPEEFEKTFSTIEKSKSHIVDHRSEYASHRAQLLK